MAPLSNLRSDIQSLRHASFKRSELKDPAHIQGEEISQGPENQRQRSVCVCVCVRTRTCMHSHLLILPERNNVSFIESCILSGLFSLEKSLPAVFIHFLHFLEVV